LRGKTKRICAACEVLALLAAFIHSLNMCLPIGSGAYSPE